MNVLVRAALEGSPPRDPSLRPDVRKQTPSGRITRLITARRRAARRPRRSPPRTGPWLVGGRRAAGSVTSCGLPLVLITTHERRRQLLGLFFFPSPPWRPRGPLPLTQPAAQRHSAGGYAWDWIVIVDNVSNKREKGKNTHTHIHNQI